MIVCEGRYRRAVRLADLLAYRIVRRGYCPEKHTPLMGSMGGMNRIAIRLNVNSTVRHKAFTDNTLGYKRRYQM